MKDVLRAVVFGAIFLLPFLPFYVENDFFFPYITGKNFAFRIIVEVMVAGWVILALVDKAYRPKFSWIIATFSALLGVMAVATLLAEHPHTSFWSNFERMDGYITLIHVFLLTLVMGSVMNKDSHWFYFLNTSLVVAVVIALTGLSDQVGGSERVDANLGNAAYMAVYMLFHIFFAYLLSLRTKQAWLRLVYVVSIVVLAYTLLQTGTRGTFIGLAGGSVVAVAYVALFAKRFPQLRHYAIYGMIAIALMSAVYVGLRVTDALPAGSPIARIVNIDIKEDLAVRSKIWSMALEGVKERPAFGWGPGNFNFVFNEQYRPDIWNQEQWFDRVHNIILDWLIAGGVVGLLAYLSVLGAVAYYLFVVPVVLKRETIFSVPEQAVLLGLVVAYFIHNLVVFDNIISYLFFAVVLALIHGRIAKPIAKIDNYVISEKMVAQFVAPLVILVAAPLVYFVNVPSMLAAGDIIDAMREETARGRLEEFHSALERKSFADQEIVEQLAQQAMQLSRSSNVSPEDRQMIVQRAELELLRLNDEKPNDARLHNFLATFYRTIGAIPQAREQAAIAVSLSPQKPALILEQAVIELQVGDVKAALVFLEKAFRLEERNIQARVFYASALFRDGQGEKAREIVDADESYRQEFALNDYAISSVLEAKDYEYLAGLYEIRIESDPKNAQYRASLAFLYYELKQTEKAVEVLEKAASEIPSFSEVGQCYAKNIKANKAPETPCE